jgi:general secretion pathway protein L
VAADVVTRYRIRVSRETPDTGVFEWATLDAGGAAIDRGSSDAAPLPSPGSCEVVLPSDIVSLQRVAVPAAQRKKLGSALQFLVEDLVVSDPERLHAVQAGASGKDGLDVGIVDKDWLRRTLARLAACGLRPERVLAETLLPPLEPRAWTVVWRAKESFVRTGLAEGFTLDAPPDGAAPVALRLAAAKRPGDAIVVRVAGDTQAPDAERWSSELGVPVELAAPWSWASERAEPTLDFLQGEFARDRDAQGWRARLRRPAALAAALVVVASAGLAADWAAKAGERKRLAEQINAVYREAFGPEAVIVDAPLQMQRALAELRRRNGEPGAGDFLALLDAIAGRLLDPATQRIDAMSYGNGRLALLLRPRDPAAFAGLVETLRGKAAVPGLEVRIDTVQSAEGQQVRVTAKSESGRWALAKP